MALNDIRKFVIEASDTEWNIEANYMIQRDGNLLFFLLRPSRVEMGRDPENDTMVAAFSPPFAASEVDAFEDSQTGSDNGFTS